MAALRWRKHLLWIAALPLPWRGVLLLAALLHGVGLWWGMPASDSWDVDGVAPRDVLPGLAATFTPGDYYTYPPLQLMLIALVTLPVTITAVASAKSTAVPAIIEEIIKPGYMTAITMTARVVTLVMSLGVVLCVALIAEEIAPKERKRSTAFFAALFATLNWAFSYYAHTSNLDVPYLFWALLATLWLVRAIARREPRRLRVFALFAAMAVATKDQAYAMFLLGAPAALVVWGVLDAWPKSIEQRKKVAREALIAAALCVALVLVLDGAVFNPTGFRARVKFLTGPASKDFEILSRDTWGYVLAFLDSFLYFRRHYPPIVAVFPIVGVVTTIARARSADRQTLAAAITPACVALSFSICFNVAALRAEERFTLPQMLMLAVYAGAGLDLLWNGLMTAPAKWAARSAVVVGLAMALVECLRVNATLLLEPRYATEAFLKAHAGAGDTIEVHGLNVYLPRFADLAPDVHVVRVGKNEPKRRGPMPGVEEVKAPLGEIASRSPRFVVVNECYVWRFLERDDLKFSTGHVVPSTQRADAADTDATSFFRGLFREQLGYRLAHESRIRTFDRSWMHSSLGCPMFVFERSQP